MSWNIGRLPVDPNLQLLHCLLSPVPQQWTQKQSSIIPIKPTYNCTSYCKRVCACTLLLLTHFRHKTFHKKAQKRQRQCHHLWWTSSNAHKTIHAGTYNWTMKIAFRIGNTSNNTHSRTLTQHAIVTLVLWYFLQEPDHGHCLREGSSDRGKAYPDCSMAHFERPASTADGRVTTCKEDAVTCM